MAALRGEKFHIPLDDDSDTNNGAGPSANPASTPVNVGIVRDIAEKSTAVAATPPAPPTAQNVDGFPSHKKRSRFRRQRDLLDDHDRHTTKIDQPQQAAQSFNSLRHQIDQENAQRIANLSPKQIAKERQELMANLSPALLTRLLKRASLDPQPEPSSRLLASEPQNASDVTSVHSIPNTNVEPRGPVEADNAYQAGPASSVNDFVQDLEKESTQDHHPEDYPKTHFPKAAQLPPLDPASPTFLDDLHAKYFPNLPADPTKLAWMADNVDPDLDTYNILAADLQVAQIRFSFEGQILPPSAALRIPVTAGLHHHGDAPDAAGYTIPELAHLSRSVIATQRCIAYSVLGRVLFRLGRGEFSVADGVPSGALAEGLWDCLKRGRVIETLQEEAARSRGHISAKAYANEALWLWQKGGGYMPDMENL